MKQFNAMRGMTIVQVMVMLLVLGLALSVAVNKFIDLRCKEDPARKLCQNRTGK
jgi:hypothetical protein